MSSRSQTVLEEWANSLSHGLGLLAAVVALPALILANWQRGHPVAMVGAVIFGVTLLLVYLTSTLYHALPDGRVRQWLLKLDHGAIYLFIAGSYTPFALGVPTGWQGWLLFGVVWAVALAGVSLKLLGYLSRPLYSTGLYLLMGWVVLIAAYPLAAHLTPTSLAWLISGGVAYTVGVVFFALDARLRFGHFIWHLFVMAGSTCHCLAVFWQAAK